MRWQNLVLRVVYVHERMTTKYVTFFPLLLFKKAGYAIFVAFAVLWELKVHNLCKRLPLGKISISIIFLIIVQEYIIHCIQDSKGALASILTMVYFFEFQDTLEDT